MHCHNHFLKQNTKCRKIMTLDTVVKHRVSSDFSSTLYKEHLKNGRLLKTSATKLEIMIHRNKFMLDKVWWGWKTQPYKSCTGIIKTVLPTFLILPTFYMFSDTTPQISISKKVSVYISNNLCPPLLHMSTMYICT
jgi:hypothetical protein